MRNIFVTGSSGYLGTRLIEKLAAGKSAGTIVGADIVAPPEIDREKRFPGNGHSRSRYGSDSLPTSD